MMNAQLISSRLYFPGTWSTGTPADAGYFLKTSVLRLVKKFSEFYETRRFIAAITTTRHLSLSSGRSIQSMPSITLLEDIF
jgi:hypothetical protein